MELKEKMDRMVEELNATITMTRTMRVRSITIITTTPTRCSPPGVWRLPGSSPWRM